MNLTGENWPLMKTFIRLRRSELFILNLTIYLVRNRISSLPNIVL